MIEQHGSLRLSKGSMGKTTFVKSRDGFRAQEKVIVPAGRFQNAPSFARVRENASEFGGAGTSGKVIREAINSLLPGIADPRMVSRLLQRVSKVIKSDTVSPRGKGNVVDGNTLLLKDFEFNVNTKLKSVFRPKFTTDINRVTGQLTLNVPVHTPNLDLAVPKDCTHYQFISAGVEINFEHQSSKEDIHVSAYLPVGLTATTALAIVHTVKDFLQLLWALSIFWLLFKMSGLAPLGSLRGLLTTKMDHD